MRIVESLNKNWKFSKRSELPEQVPCHCDKQEGWEKVEIPHSYNAFDGQDGGGDYYRGKVVYVKRVNRPNVPEDYKIYVEFEGVNSIAEVFLNGEKVCEHRGGYSTFRVDATDALKDGKMELGVIVDNKNYSDVYPQMADFTFYGGIYRDVNIVAVPQTHFCLDYYGSKGLAFDTKIMGKDARVNLNSWVTNPQESDMVQFEIYDEEGETVAEAFTPAKEVSSTATVIPSVHLWQGVKDPYLYTVVARLIRHNEVLDEVEANLGVREFYVDPEKGFFLNGESMPLRGVSRHQDMLGKGNALTEEDHWDDAYMIAELGANTVRLAHYQHNQAFYDACDELGFIVWAEIPFISVMSKDPKGHENCREQMKELIYQNYNHPSICFWGISNEITIGGEREGLQENLEDLNKLVKELDTTRLTTMAQVSALPKESKQNQITDVVSYNHYFGWYGGDYTENEKWFDEFHAMYPDRGFGISEYGCEGIVSWHTDEPKCKDYTEEYQAEYHEHMAKIIDERPYLWATHIWNMFDFGCDARDEGGVKGRNNKGLVTLDRKIKKDAYFIYKAYWSEEPFVHITGRRYAERPYETMTVKVYSNQKEVTLYVNGEEKATVKGDKIFLFENIELTEEINVITAKADGCTVDTVTFKKVSEPNPAYVRPEEEDDSLTDGARNWFEGVDENGELPELTFKEGYYSIHDLVSEILENDDTANILISAINTYGTMQTKRSMLGIMGGVSFLDMSAMVASEPEKADRMLKMANVELQKIKKA